MVFGGWFDHGQIHHKNLVKLIGKAIWWYTIAYVMRRQPVSYSGVEDLSGKVEGESVETAVR